MYNHFYQHFHFEIKNGCIVYKDGSDVVLLDTGSQQTINVANDHLHIFPKIHEFVDSSITILKGMNTMSHRKILVDYLNSEIFINGIPEIASPIARFEIDLRDLWPTIQISIDGQMHRMLLDTGARTSYLFTPYVNVGDPVGEIDDFFIGEPSLFKVKLFEHRVDVGDQSVCMNFAPPTESIANTLVYLGVDGIIGYEFFRNFKVLFDFERKRFVVGR